MDQFHRICLMTNLPIQFTFALLLRQADYLHAKGTSSWNLRENITERKKNKSSFLLKKFIQVSPQINSKKILSLREWPRYLKKSSYKFFELETMNFQVSLFNGKVKKKKPTREIFFLIFDRICKNESKDWITLHRLLQQNVWKKKGFWKRKKIWNSSRKNLFPREK